MSFNYALAKEIYGVPWSVDSVSFLQLSSILKNLQNGVVLDAPDVKMNSISILDVSNNTRIISNEFDLNNSESFEGIGIINLNGVITKSGGASSYGTKQISAQMLKMSLDSRIKGFIMLTDSGGGATGAVQLMQDAVSKVRETKPVYALIEKGGMAGSAAYGIISSATKIFSEDEMNIVGSAGTMIQFSGIPNGTVDTDGEKHITLYATKSVAKNKGFNEAIENDNYSILVNDLLDPINENFLSKIISNRPQLEGSNYDNGHTMFSKDAVGTFIDGIASFDEVVSMVLSDSKVESKININSNPKQMNKQELKQNHPELYSEILSEGVVNEQERVSSWEAYREADSKAVSEGIASGKEITVSQSHRFQVALASKGMLEKLKSDNAGEIVTNPTETVDNGEAGKVAKELESAFDFKI